MSPRDRRPDEEEAAGPAGPAGKPKVRRTSGFFPPDVAAVLAQEFAEEMEVVATITVDSLWKRMLGEFLVEWARLQRMELSDDELERAMQAFMDELSERPIEELARKSVGVAYNEGRNVGIQAGAVDVVMRSEVLDKKTCGPCATLDRRLILVDSPEYEALMPPALCEGGDNCRGFYVVMPQMQGGR